jgi:hypothetical protein
MAASPDRLARSWPGVLAHEHRSLELVYVHRPEFGFVLDGTPTLLFDFPVLGRGDAVTEAFDPVYSIGLFELLWDASAPVGFVNTGEFTLSGE